MICPGEPPSPAWTIRPSRSGQRAPSTRRSVSCQRRRIAVAEREVVLILVLGVSIAKADLVEPRALAHAHRKAARRNLDEERPFVFDRRLVEGFRAVGDQPREDVEAAGRAFWVGGAGEAGQQRQPLLQRRDIDDALFQHGALAGEVDALGVEAFELIGDRALLARQETGADAERFLAQAQVEAGGLELPLLDRARRLDQPPRIHRLQLLRVKHPEGRYKAGVVHRGGVGQPAGGVGFVAKCLGAGGEAGSPHYNRKPRLRLNFVGPCGKTGYGLPVVI